MKRQALTLNGIQIGEQIVDLGRVKLELGHGRMSRCDAFGKGFRKILDGLAGVQGPEGWRLRDRAFAETADGMALGAVHLHEREPALHPSRLSHGGR